MQYKVIEYTAAKRERWLAEGRGAGVGADYKPWLRVEDVSSKSSYKDRIRDGHHFRECHLLSAIEQKAFSLFDCSRYTIAIYEQFRLDIDETKEIASTLRIDHPRVQATGELWDVTTDLVVVQIRDGKKIVVPINAKPPIGLGDLNQMEHAMIERQWWGTRGHQLKFFTGRRDTISAIFERNIELLNHTRFLDQVYPTLDFNGILERLLSAVFSPASAHLSLFLLSTVVKRDLPFGGLDLQQLILHFIYRHAIVVDLHECSIFSQSVERVRELTRKFALPYLTSKQRLERDLDYSIGA